MLLAPFDIKFMPQKVVKGQVIADFLAANPCPINEELPDDLSDHGDRLVERKSWELYFDGAARNRGAGVGIVFVMPSGGLVPYSLSLLKLSSNNMAEYEAIIMGVELAIEMCVGQLKVFSDSHLIIQQINGRYEVRNAKLLPLYQGTKNLMA